MNKTHVEITMTGHGLGMVKVNDQEMPCTSVMFKAAVDCLNEVTLTLAADQVSVMLDDAIVRIDPDDTKRLAELHSIIAEHDKDLHAKIVKLLRQGRR